MPGSFALLVASILLGFLYFYFRGVWAAWLFGRMSGVEMRIPFRLLLGLRFKGGSPMVFAQGLSVCRRFGVSKPVEDLAELYLRNPPAFPEVVRLLIDPGSAGGSGSR